VLLLIGLGIRLYDLTDPPLDFHETRQLGSAAIARGIYYRVLPDAPDDVVDLATRLADQTPVYEPRLMETLVAFSYLLAGGEYLWIARVISSIFWVLGAIGLYVLAREWTSAAGGLTAVAFYLILPYGVIASRSFQPDPLMTALIVYSLLAIWRWSEEPSDRRAAIAGAVSAAAILAKAVAAFPVLGAIVAAGLAVLGIRHVWKDRHVWAMLVIAVLPALVYYLFLTPGGPGGFVTFWVISLRDLLRQPFFYVRWVQQVEYVIGFGWLIVGLAGILLIGKRVGRVMLVGAWAGYLVYGLAFPFQIMTHDYYHLMLIPMVALGLASWGAMAYSFLADGHWAWRLAAFGVAAFAAVFLLWEARVTLAAEDYRLEAVGWSRLTEIMPDDGAIVAISHGYGTRLRYYAWTGTSHWPGVADIGLSALAGAEDFDYEAEFRERTNGASYFLINNFGELDNQPELKAILYQRYPIYEEGDGYLIFDLSQRIDEDAQG
jgi:hypothetical protein